MENNLYKVDKIEGKGVGCIALQDIKPGTLILKEVPQCVAKKELVYFSQEGMAVLLDDDYLTSNSKEFICFSLGLSGSESLPIIFLAHLWDFLFKFF